MEKRNAWEQNLPEENEKRREGEKTSRIVLYSGRGTTTDSSSATSSGSTITPSTRSCCGCGYRICYEAAATDFVSSLVRVV